MNPKISIIVPIYKYDIYFNKCLDFLIAQSLADIEIIIIDDCSPDDIPSNISEYLKNKKISYYRQSLNSGPGGARNSGMAIAKGRYIIFCDSDDWIDLNYCQKAYEYMESTGADIGMLGQIREYDTSSQPKVYKCRYNQFYELSGEMAFQIMTYNYQSEIRIIPPCNNKIYRRSFLVNNNYRFQENVYFQDTIFSVETILHCGKIICIPDALYHHYRRSGSIIQSFDQKHIDDFKNLGISVKKHLTANNIYEKYNKNYYNLITHFYGVIIREIFQFIHNDQERKKYMMQTFNVLETIIDKSEYINYLTADQLRRHLFPEMEDTTLY